MDVAVIICVLGREAIQVKDVAGEEFGP